MSTTMPQPPTTPTGLRLLRNYVGGEWVDARTNVTMDIVNPATGQALAQVPLGTAADVDAAVAAATAAFPAWRSRSTIERARWLYGLRQAMLDRQDEIARTLTPRWARPCRMRAPRSAARSR